MFLERALNCVTSGFPDGEVESRAGLWRDAEVDGGVLPSLIPVDSSQNLNNLNNTEQDALFRKFSI